MPIENILKNNKYTLNGDGVLTKIVDMDKSVDWFSAIKHIESQLDEAHQKEEIVMLYRGESREMFGLKTGNMLATNEDPNYERFFVIGSKAKSYLISKNRNLVDLKQFDSKVKAKYVYHSLHKLSNKHKFKKVLNYFNDNSKYADFEKKLLGIENVEDRLTVENFYLAFLHTFSSIPVEILTNSVLISSSRNIEIAKGFSGKGFIIASWLSNPVSSLAIDYNKINKYKDLLTKYNMPVIEKINYPDESEVTIFSGIFPHNIFYVYDLSKKYLVFNPYILKTDLNNFVASGFNVDQRHFNVKIQGIYFRSIWRRGNKLIAEEEAF